MPSNETTVVPDVSPADIPDILPVIPLRDVVIFPHMIFPVLVGRESSIKAVNKAIDEHKLLFVCSQTNPADDNPAPDALHQQGTVARILQVLKLPNGLMKVLVDGLYQSKARKIWQTEEEFLLASVTVIEPRFRESTRLTALVRQLDSLFQDYVKLQRNIPNETLIGYEALSDPLRRLYYVAANLLVPIETKQSILRLERLDEQLYELIGLLSNEIEIMKVELEIDDRVHSTIQKSQRKYFIQEQIKLLQKELGEEEEDIPSGLAEIRAKILDAGMPEEPRKKALDEFGKLREMSPMSPEATVSRNYIDWLASMPWKVRTEDNLSLENARRVLEADHYGLEKPKDRILEHIAVLNLVKEIKGQILCLVGPPGVGKTSLGRSIARALNRKFARVSLGGVHDEAEIRGHRRTYIGSMPGKIIQAVKKAGSMNPVILLDEIDKMSSDFQGDPASAMLEVLDPEQNNTFNDHYLDIDFDLSKVLFITTANVRFGIPLPLQDRMEIIELPGYLEHDKLEIAKRHLVKKQILQHGLKPFRIRFSNEAILKIVRQYTLEAGVRNLERELATVCRKISKRIVAELDGGKSKRGGSIDVTPELVEEYLGVPKIKQKSVSKTGSIGSVIGLAWTSVGGDILRVDVATMAGTDKLALTGQLGDVMKESAQAALSYLRSRADEFGLPPSAFEKRDIHIHLPEGAIPKDGPSAGLTMTIGMLSALKKQPARGDIAMTGEIALHGDVLPIGGLNEKLLAARRHGITTVIIPRDNMPDLKEISPRIMKGLKILPVSTIAEAIALMLPEPEQEKKPKRKSGRRA